ncbi:hypothetical protein [Paenibacillus senegalensis]|nr:hypothetical protein [Paenibacillus senegalensis]
MNINEVLERAKLFLYRNGRLLDRRRFEYFFEGGSKEAVIEALRSYQNPDGGFGNALEPDIRCPYSQPIPTEVALHIMDELDYFPPDLLEGIINYVKQTTLSEGGLPLIFRNAGEYPSTPWWKVERDDLPSMNPTGTIIGLLYKQKTRTDFFREDWFKKSVHFLWHYMETEKPKGYHDGIHWITFLQHTPETARAEKYLKKVDEWLQLPETIELDPEAEGYVHKVLDWVPQKGDYPGKFISDTDVNVHLQALIRQQAEDGGWPISWQAVGPGAEAEWRGYLTVERLKTLRSYGII